MFLKPLISSTPALLILAQHALDMRLARMMRMTQAPQIRKTVIITHTITMPMVNLSGRRAANTHVKPVRIIHRPLASMPVTRKHLRPHLHPPAIEPRTTIA